MAFDIEGARQSGYSDDEILRYLSEQNNFDLDGARQYYGDADILNHLAGQPAAAEPAPEEELETTFFGQVGETLKAVPRGFANSFLSAGEGVAELADAATNAVGFEDAIDSGDQNALVAASREGRRLVQEYLGADEAYRDEWFTKFGEGVGSFASFFTPTVAVKALGLAGKAAKAAEMGKLAQAARIARAERAAQTGLTGTLAAGTGAGDQAQRIQAARDAGLDVSEADEDTAILLGGLVGLTELAPVERILRRIPRMQTSSSSKALWTGSRVRWSVAELKAHKKLRRAFFRMLSSVVSITKTCPRTNPSGKISPSAALSVPLLISRLTLLQAE